jgi:trigger factor
MQITETLSEGLKRELKITIGANELDERLNAKLDELKDKVRLKGFRPGKVPVGHIRKVYGQSIMAEVVEEALNESRTKALSERDERPAFQPSITLPEDESTVKKVMDGAADLEFTMAFEVLPRIELADLKGIKLERPVAEVSNEEVGKTLDRLREGNVAYDAKEGAAEDGDRLTIDFVGKIDGEPFEGGTAEGATVVMGRGGFIPGFEEGMLGAKAGDERTVKALFPENYQATPLAGKDAEFDIKVKEVASPRLPEADDEFAKSLGLETLDKLKEAIRDQIAKDYGRASRQKAKHALLDALDEAHRFELPPSLVDSEFETIWKEITGQLERRKTTFEAEGTSEDEARAKYREMAERRVRLGLILAEIGQRNEVTVTDEEVRRAIMERAQQFPGQERQVIQFYKENPNALLELRMPLFEEKVVDFAIELADVSDKQVSPEELFKPESDEFGFAENDQHQGDDHEHVHGPDCDHDHDHDHDHGDSHSHR